MEVEKDKIKDLFSSKLGSFEPEVPASVWGGLDQLLSNQPVSPAETTSSGTSASSAAGNTSLIKTIAIIVGVSIAVAAGIFYLSSEKNEEIIVLPKQEESKEIIIDSVQIEEVDTVKSEPPILSYKYPNKEENPIEESVLLPEEELNTEYIEEEQKQGVEKEEESGEIKVETEPENILIVPEQKTNKRGFSFGVVADMGLASFDRTELGSGLLFSREIRSEAFLEALDSEGSELRLKHNRPISVGLTVSKELSSRFSIETGLIYSYLSSEVDSESRFLIREEQRFSYIGLPLSINYTFAELGKTRIYLSLGAMIQKDIKGHYISRIDLSKREGEQILENELYYKEPYYVKKTIKQRNPQISARTVLGIAHPLYKKLYIYGAIGGVYYFDSNNKYRTIYSDKNFQLGLDLGVKYEF